MEYYSRQRPEYPPQDYFQSTNEVKQEHPPEYVPSAVLAQRDFIKSFCSSANPHSVPTFSGAFGEAPVTRFFPTPMNQLVQQRQQLPLHPEDSPLHPTTDIFSPPSSCSGSRICTAWPETTNAVDSTAAALKEIIHKILIFSLLLNLLQNMESDAPSTNIDPDIDDGVRVVIRPFNLSDYPLRRIPSYRWGSESTSTT
ncbi:hypothetical protein SprV_0401504700 [Sparganum proliferum]